MALRLGGLGALTPEQRLFLWQYALADDALVSDPENTELMRIRDSAYDHLVQMGIYPCYDSEDDVYTYIYG